MNWDKFKDACYAVLFVVVMNVPLILVAMSQGHDLKTMLSFGG
jgi:hypothetical protein